VQTVLRDIRERTEKAQRYQTVSLLVLDDLGSEPNIPTFPSSGSLPSSTSAPSQDGPPFAAATAR
jgi:hypothetical protein